MTPAPDQMTQLSSLTLEEGVQLKGATVLAIQPTAAATAQAMNSCFMQQRITRKEERTAATAEVRNT
jgi:hypothetical protein